MDDIADGALGADHRSRNRSAVERILVDEPASHLRAHGFTAYFATSAQLFRELELGRADGSYAKKLRALGHVDVLIVDDWAMAPMAEAERRAFLEICDES